MHWNIIILVKNWYETVVKNICFMVLWNQKVSLKYFFLNASCCHHRFRILQNSRCLMSYLDKSFNELNFQINIVPYHLNWTKKLQTYNNYALLLETILKDLVVNMGWVRGCSEYTALRFRFPKNRTFGESSKFFNMNNHLKTIKYTGLDKKEELWKLKRSISSY